MQVAQSALLTKLSPPPLIAVCSSVENGPRNPTCTLVAKAKKPGKMDARGGLNLSLRTDSNLDLVKDNESQFSIPVDGLEPLPSQDNNEEKKLLYEVEESPSWGMTFLFGFQHFLTMLGATTVNPFIYAPALCISPDDPAKAYILSTMVFVSGVVTFLQSTIGVRLPILQGVTISYIIPILSILSKPKWACPEGFLNSTAPGSMNSSFNNWTQEEKDKLWQDRIREVQGCVFIASFVEIFIGLTGLAGLLLRFITPLAMMPVMTLVGLALFEHAANMASQNWAIAALTAVLMIVFAEYMGEVTLPFGGYSKEKGCYVIRLPIFKLFPVLLSIILVWIICAILTECNVFSANDPARTDVNKRLMETAPWFRIPYPGQWGMPTANLAGVCGIIAAVLATVIQSVGNYYASAQVCGVAATPTHAVNRGILVEGLGSMLAGLLGSCDGTSPYAENTGIVGVTKVASRRVLQAAGLLMIFFGLMSKFGALFAAMPEPIIGGTFFVMLSLIASVGLANLQFVDFKAPRNLIVAGFPLFCGLALPIWIKHNSNAIATGYEELDNILEVMLSTSMFVGGVFGFILDNTIPGTPEERGITQWAEQMLKHCGGDESGSKCYEFPYGMECLRKSRFARLLPVSPSFDPSLYSCRRKTSVPSLPARATTNGNMGHAHEQRL